MSIIVTFSYIGTACLAITLVHMAYRQTSLNESIKNDQVMDQNF